MKYTLLAILLTIPHVCHAAWHDTALKLYNCHPLTQITSINGREERTYQCKEGVILIQGTWACNADETDCRDLSGKISKRPRDFGGGIPNIDFIAGECASDDGEHFTCGSYNLILEAI